MLGAKTRIPRNLRTGSKDGNSGKEIIERRSRKKAGSLAGSDDADGELDGEMWEPLTEDQNTEIPDFAQTPYLLGTSGLNMKRKPLNEKGKSVPNWKKKIEKKRARRAMAESRGRG